MDKTETESGQSESSGAGKRAIFAWCFFDWANSAFPTVIITFVFAAYVTKVVAGDVELGTARWGTAVSISALFVAVLAPILGAIADRGGRRKPWIVLFTALCIAAGAALWGVGPDPVSLLLALVLVGLANAAFELGQRAGQRIAGRIARARIVVLAFVAEAGEREVRGKVHRRYHGSVLCIRLDGGTNGAGGGTGRGCHCRLH